MSQTIDEVVIIQKKKKKTAYTKCTWKVPKPLKRIKKATI